MKKLLTAGLLSLALLTSAQSNNSRDNYMQKYKLGIEASISPSEEISLGLNAPIFKSGYFALGIHSAAFVVGKFDVVSEQEEVTHHKDQYDRPYSSYDWIKTTSTYKSYAKIGATFELGMFQLGGGLIFKNKTINQSIESHDSYDASSSSFNFSRKEFPTISTNYSIPYVRLGMEVIDHIVLGADVSYDSKYLGPSLHILLQFRFPGKKYSEPSEQNYISE